MNSIHDNIVKIQNLCTKYKVKDLFVFGSVLTPRFNAKSDIDMLVYFKDVPIEDYAENYFNLKFQLSELLGRDVDLIEEKGIRNPIFRRNVNNSRVKIYG